ncbi:S-receptor-like serine/threonine-protein kinase [Parasponia andersonii]|uniref:Receptor-like serine/threonine-protein kinase n=1 Tax=Parasponia andersonii TaxID=3476 RepID=A0A2P5DGS3_PARAD|nr:S-receptor-like serine/threonine-protein kinase [Parasponia andersonii]
MGFANTVIQILVVSILLIISNSINVKAQRNHSNIVIGLGSTLSANNETSQYWLSPSGIFAFGFYPSQANKNGGFAVGIWIVNQPQTNNTIVWTAKRDDPPFSPSATLKLTSDGLHLITVTGDNQPTEDKIIPRPAISGAAMLDSGNFVVYGRNLSDVIWESFDFPTDTMLGGQNLTYGSELVSSMSRWNHSSGLYQLIMQTDGNLVMYPTNAFIRSENAYWSSGFLESRFHTVNLRLNNSGFLYLFSTTPTGGYGRYKMLAKGSGGSNRPSENETVIYRVTLDPDGIFRLYSHHISNDKSSRSMFREWSILNNQCDVKGFCGLNSYCAGGGTSKTGKDAAECYCYPGFVFINPSIKNLGCYQNFSEDSCRGGEDEDENRLGLRYNISTLENVWWEDHPYSVTPVTKEACSESCLKECDCWATLYTSLNCGKYRLPLRYGKRISNITSTAFFKMVSGNYQINKIHPHAKTQRPVSIEGKNSPILVLGLILGSVACLCVVIAVSSFVIYKRRVYKYKRLFEHANLGLAEDFVLQPFSYEELERATDGFREKLGRGSFGAVYKGTLSGANKTIAVKRLEKVVEEGIREFRAEMTTIGRTHHRNLVQLLGFCIEGSKRLLVYEFMSNGSLAELLFKAVVRPAWKERVRFALDVARGLLYLHEECGVHIINCNLKPQNILLDDTWTAKISDFGFARLLVPNQVKVSMRFEERTGYFAPELQKNALISVKADIYSFGVVLLEIICCRRSIDVKVSSPDAIALSNWVYTCFITGELNKLVELDEDVEMRTLERMVKVGLWCIQDDPALRPSTKNVILMLEGAMDIPIPPSPELLLARSS